MLLEQIYKCLTSKINKRKSKFSFRTRWDNQQRLAIFHSHFSTPTRLPFCPLKPKCVNKSSFSSQLWNRSKKTTRKRLNFKPCSKRQIKCTRIYWNLWPEFSQFFCSKFLKSALWFFNQLPLNFFRFILNRSPQRVWLLKERTSFS